ncbi:hypothetical protein [Streptomyces sp. C1-2]|uniref:hypothetical protein n=1 Tax=Streptomyces sp. C1-2 TaxID=2720022 RepID=UPI00143242FA|nr:hypothetical protein [Streptomyces sp. C1-2]NJP73186.1 hypothetical protein [Streptomyces sp. C1-2]
MTSVIPEPSTMTPDPSDQRAALVKATQLRTGTYKNTAVCVFDGSTATTTRTGDSGNVFSLCTPCATAYDADTVTSAGCPVYPGLCTQTGGHTEHSNHTHGVDRTGWPVSVGFVQLETGEPFLYVDKGLAVDFFPEDAPHTAAQLRAAADAIEGMAAKVETARALARLRKVRETADIAFATVLTIMERAVVNDGADPVEVGERVLELLAEVRAEGDR